MKKVLHVSHSLDTGGGPLYIKKIIQDVPQIDHYVAGNSGHYYFLFEKILGEQKVRSLRGKNLIYNIWVLKKFCKERSISIVHCHGRGAALYSRLLKLLIPKIQIIYTIHGFHPDTLNPIVKPFYIFSEKILYYLTDAVISVSLSEKKRFIEKVGPANAAKIFYIPNYITADDVKPEPLPLTLDPDCINFLFVGRLSPEKGIDILLEAWVKVENKNCRLYIIGYGPLEILVRSHLNDNRIIYLGKVENASSFISHFDSVIIPSRFEGMPYIGLESMISKACVIVTPAVGITDLFGHDTSYMAKDFLADSLHQAIASYIEDFTNKRAQIADRVQRSYERVQKEFSQKNAQKIVEIYQSFANLILK